MEIQHESYQNLLAEIKNSMHRARVRAGQYLYWHIGKTVTERQETEGWASL